MKKKQTPAVPATPATPATPAVESTNRVIPFFRDKKLSELNSFKTAPFNGAYTDLQGFKGAYTDLPDIDIKNQRIKIRLGEVTEDFRSPEMLEMVIGIYDMTERFFEEYAQGIMKMREIPEFPIPLELFWHVAAHALMYGFTAAMETVQSKPTRTDARCSGQDSFTKPKKRARAKKAAVI